MQADLCAKFRYGTHPSFKLSEGAKIFDEAGHLGFRESNRPARRVEPAGRTSGQEKTVLGKRVIEYAIRGSEVPRTATRWSLQRKYPWAIEDAVRLSTCEWRAVMSSSSAAAMALRGPGWRTVGALGKHWQQRGLQHVRLKAFYVAHPSEPTHRSDINGQGSRKTKLIVQICTSFARAFVAKTLFGPFAQDK